MADAEAARMIDQAQALLDANRVAEAKTLYQAICARDPRNAEAFFMLGAINGETGQLDEAVRSLEKAIALQPDDADAHYTLGSVLKAQGEPQAALAHAERAVALAPDYAEAWLLFATSSALLGKMEAAETGCHKAIELGLSSPDVYLTLGDTCRAQGKLPEAREHLETAVRLEPDHAEAWLLLGAVQGMLGNYHSAEASSRHVVGLQPDNADAHKNLGNALKDQGRYDTAISSYQKALELQPENADAWLGLGTCYLSVAGPKEAEACYRKAVELGPESVDACLFLGRSLRLQGKFEDAEKYCRHALALAPGIASVYKELGDALLAQGKPDDALASYQEALRIAPNDPATIAGKAAVYERRGAFTESLETIQPCLELDPPECGIVSTFARLSRHFDHQSHAISLITRLLARPAIGRFDRAQLHFRLGNLYDETGDHEQAFEHIQAGNELAAQCYDPAVDEKYVDDLFSSYTTTSMAKLPRASCWSERPVFIVGMPRSGTSLVEQILATHPQVFGAGELDDIRRFSENLPALLGGGAPYPRCVEAITQDVVDGLSKEYLRKLDRLGGDAERVTDKMPHNFLHLGLIELLFPRARIIHCVRDPLDTCLSCYFRSFAGHLPYKYNLAHLGEFYRQYQRLMQHWKAVLHLSVMDVRYEELVENPEALSRSLVEFCGLDWDERCLRFYEAKRFVRTASYDQVRQPIYKQAVGRWRKYQEHLGPLKVALGL